MADALSRKKVGHVVLSTMISSNKVILKELEVEMKLDQDLQGIRHELQAGTKEHIGFVLVDDKFMYKGCLVMPRKSAVIPVLCVNTMIQWLEAISGNSKRIYAWQLNGNGWVYTKM